MAEAQLLSSRQALEELCRQQPFDPRIKRVGRIIQSAIAWSVAGLAAWGAYASFEMPPQEYKVLSLEGFKFLGDFLEGTWDAFLLGATALGISALGAWRLVDAASTYTPVSFRHSQNGPAYFKDGGFLLDPWLLRRFFSRNVRPADSASELETMLEGKKSAGLVLLNGTSITDKRVSYAKINTTFKGKPIRVDTAYGIDKSRLESTNLGNALQGRTENTRFLVLGELHKEDEHEGLTKRNDGAYVLDLDYICPALMKQEPISPQNL